MMASLHRRPTVTYYQDSHYYLYPQHSVPPTANPRRGPSAIPEPQVHHQYIPRAPITHSFYFLESEDQDHKRSIRAWVEEQQKYQATGGYKATQARFGTFPTTEDEREDEGDWGRRDRRIHYCAEHGAGSQRRAEDMGYLRAQYEVRKEAMRKEAERRKVAAERARAHAEFLERERREREKADRSAVDAWNRYEDGWSRRMRSSEPLSFATIPWPMLKSPSSVDKINVAAVTLFLMSPAHSHDISRKERLRNAQLRWHPDRFRRYINRVRPQDRAAVEEGVGIIARGLNELMTREVNHVGLAIP